MTDPRAALRALVHRHRDALVAALSARLSRDVLVAPAPVDAPDGARVVAVAARGVTSRGGLIVHLTCHASAPDALEAQALHLAVQVALTREPTVEVDGSAARIEVDDDGDTLIVRVIGG